MREVEITEWVSPFVLKMLVESSNKYKKAYKSYAFGLVGQIQAKWLYFLILGVVGVVMLLYFTGYIRV